VHKRLLDALGVKGIVELLALLGHYNMIAMTLNANEYGLPPGVAPPLAAVSGKR
jgi:4-carboxymuconolactone decarboxylase